MVADKLSRLGQTIQTEWSRLQEVFQAICSSWHRPQLDLFATWFNNKLPLFVSSIPDPLHSVCHGRYWTHMPSHQQPSWAKWWRSCSNPHARESFRLLRGGPTCLGFWDLVAMSSQIPVSLSFLPNLLTQPFNQIPHRNLTNLTLHAWLLEPHQSRSRASLKQWQQELRLLKEDQPDQSVRQSGPFLQVVRH